MTCQNFHDVETKSKTQGFYLVKGFYVVVVSYLDEELELGF
jgi:hypothetical protein